MLAYLIKCFVTLLTLWTIQFLEIFPWPGTVNLVAIVIVPIALVALGWRAAARQGEQRGVTDYRRLRRASARHILANGQTEPDAHEVGR